jgi:lysophospholipase L1-like esterase
VNQINKFKLLSVALFCFIVYPFYTIAQVKIMPLGDSITRGSAGSWNTNSEHILIGYRGPLFDSLRNAGYQVDFVGSGYDGPPSIPYDGVPQYYDYNHEGHSGWQAVEPTTDGYYPNYDMASHLDSFLVMSSPNIILFQLGTNDLETGQSPGGVVNDVQTLLNKIYAYNPNMTVFLAKIINRGNQVNSSDSSNFSYGSTLDSFNDPTAPSNIKARTSAFNDSLVLVAKNRIINGNNMILVDLTKAITNYNEDTTASQSFPYGEMWDSFHPNQSGYNKMAGVWFKSLNNYLTGKPQLFGPSKDSLNVQFPFTLTWTVGYKDTSYVVQVSKDSTFNPDSLIYNSVTKNRYAVIDTSITNLLSETKYYWRIGGQNSHLAKTIYSDTSDFITRSLGVALKVYLQGPYSGGDSMFTTLNQNENIPLSQPYNIAPWNYNGDERVAAIPPGVVDWILVELRKGTSSSSRVARRAAFLKQDGSIVDLDGISQVKFKNITAGGYYVVIMHRNHLAVMSADTVSIPNLNVYDFTESQSKAYGTNPMTNLGGGKYGMIVGDNNNDGVISVSDYNEIAKHLSQKGYYIPDDNMNGIVSLSDYNFVAGNLFKYSQVP